MIQSVDSIKILKQINKYAERNKRIINCLIQVKVSTDLNKYGFSVNDYNLFIKSDFKNEFPFVNIIKNLPKKNSLFETILVAANDEYVNLFLSKKISYNELLKKLINFISKKEYARYKLIEPKKIIDILKLNKYVRSTINLK